MTVLNNILKGKIVIVGIGNIMRADDGIGPHLIKKIAGKVNAVCIDAGMTPENYIRTITEQLPDTVLLVDAVDLGMKPGVYRVLRKNDILDSGFTTHNMSLKLFINFLEKNSFVKIFMLAIQPLSTNFGLNMSKQVKKTLNYLEKQLQQVK